MSPHLQIGAPVLVAVLKTIILVIGGLITRYAYLASKRRDSKSLRALAAGIGVITAGVFIAGFVDILVPVDWRLALVVESAFTAIGFGILLYSLHIE